MLISFKRSQGSVILRVKIRDSSQTDGRGLTGLTFASSGLVISTIADNEASPTSYSVAGSTIEDITTLGTYAAPSATKCRFKEVSSTLHKGVYEIQLADARFAVANAKSLLVSILGATNAAECDALVPLTDTDPYSGDAYTSLTAAQSEPAQGAPAANASVVTKIAHLFKAWRNKKIQTATQLSIYDDAGTTVDHKSTISDDGTTTTFGEISSGP